jgi:hypothetical protein
MNNITVNRHGTQFLLLAMQPINVVVIYRSYRVGVERIILINSTMQTKLYINLMQRNCIY